ncbi:C-type lectin domain family 2 member D3-like isoform X4 [Carettochelys insculpta]|uniref:C-type lectin domain family 2 member D3-like isoform X4 n=1 Tax=Carettochelys insculpta TaxID=44489 RepID=UPI003EBDBB93
MEKLADSAEQSQEKEMLPLCNGRPEPEGQMESEEIHHQEPRSMNGLPGSGATRRGGDTVGVCKPPVACSSAWLAFEGKCYYFSEIEGNWTYSRSNCSALGASLAAVDTQPEHDFMLRYKGFRDHWIGLQREEDSQPWRWVNGTEFNQWFQIGGGGQCAYLKESTTVSSSRCSMERHWICRRALK